MLSNCNTPNVYPLFMTSLVVEDKGDGLHWEVMEDLCWHTSRYTGVCVYAGFITDFASTPWIVWSVFPPEGKWDKAAVLHDWLYSTGQSQSRKEADDTFLEAMRISRVPWWKRTLMYYAVRFFGGSHYGRP